MHTRTHAHTHTHSLVEKLPAPSLYLQVEGFENPKAAVPDPGNSGPLQSHVKPTAAKCSCEVCVYTLCRNICYLLLR